jgi:O-antigen ligase
MIGALIVLGIVLAALIGLAPTLDRFEPDALKLSGEGRYALYAATLRAGLDFLPFGSGLSTFASVFPRYQAGAFGGYIDYAHNDYLQAFMEMGLVGATIAVLMLATWAARMNLLLRQAGTRSFAVLQVAAGVALLPPIVHSLFDFALHMPGNAVWCATLAGVMLHPGAGEAAPVGPVDGSAKR